MRSNNRAEAGAAFERITELPMALLALVFAALVVVPWLVELPDSVESSMLALEWTLWAMFAVELLVKTYLAADRALYVKSHWFDVVIVVVPFLRPLRVARSARAIRAIRITRAAALVTRSAHSFASFLGATRIHYVAVTALIAFFGSAAVITVLESGADGNIENFGDALWWAATTITTVGYGDTFPVTPEGRGVAIFLMLLGITLFSVLTANLAAFLVSPNDRDSSDPTLREVVDQLTRIESELRELRERLTIAR